MKIEPIFWDRSEQRCSDSELQCARVRKRVRIINTSLDKMVFEVEKQDRILAERGEFLSMEHLRKVILKIMRPVKCEKKSTPMDILKTLAQNYTSQLNIRGQKGALSTSQTYLMAVCRLERFVARTGYVLRDFSCFNKYFYDRFKEFLVNYEFRKGKSILKYTSNTVLNTICVINNLARKAYDMNMGGDSFYKASCSIMHEVAVKIYLNEKELNKMSKVKTESNSERAIIDMFIIASYTALRISDINGLNNATFGNGSIIIQQKKTKNEVCIPILKEISPLIEKYRNEGFPVINASIANSCIKELARRAGINEMILISEIRGGSKIFKQVPKYSQVSFHTARRSCITNLYKRGYGANYLMSLSGHKSLASFQRYIKSDVGEMSQAFIKELKKRRDI